MHAVHGGGVCEVLHIFGPIAVRWRRIPDAFGFLKGGAALAGWPASTVALVPCLAARVVGAAGMGLAG